MTTALSFPLDRDDFFGALKISQLSFYLKVRSEYSGTQDGNIIVKETRDPLWYAKVSTAQLQHKDIYAVQALIDAMGESLQTFYGYNPTIPGPLNDIDGTILGSSSIELSTVDAMNKLVSLSGLPSGYKLVAGDLLSFDYGAGNASRALHRVVQGSTAASGGTIQVEVRPNVRVGWTANAAVTLVKPSCEMRIVPGTFDTQSSIGYSQLSFEAVQVL